MIENRVTVGGRAEPLEQGGVGDVTLGDERGDPSAGVTAYDGVAFLGAQGIVRPDEHVDHLLLPKTRHDLLGVVRDRDMVSGSSEIGIVHRRPGYHVTVANNSQQVVTGLGKQK